MTFELKQGQRYDIPVVFGPSLIPPSSTLSVEQVAVSFLTDADILRNYLPPFFELPTSPVVTVASLRNSDVDWLGGRAYNAINVYTDVTYRGEEALSATYSLVLWESDAKPVITGRELQGYAKIVGTVPGHEIAADGTASFECLEYGTRLLRGQAWGLQPVGAAELAEMRARKDSLTFGWKYIPNLEGGADANYPTKIPYSYEVSEAMRGEGRIAFDDTTWQQAPGSSHIVTALKSLPILEARPAMLMRGVMILPRHAVRRLR